MFEDDESVIKYFFLDRKTCLKFSLDNKKSKTGQHNILKRIKETHGQQKVFGVNCLYHLAHMGVMHMVCSLRLVPKFGVRLVAEK